MLHWSVLMPPQDCCKRRQPQAQTWLFKVPENLWVKALSQQSSFYMGKKQSTQLASDSVDVIQLMRSQCQTSGLQRPGRALGRGEKGCLFWYEVQVDQYGGLARCFPPLPQLTTQIRPPQGKRIDCPKLSSDL